MHYVIGVDLGGTQLRAILADSDGHCIARTRTQTHTHAGPDAVIAQMITAIREMQAALPPHAVVRGVGIGSPGPLDPQTGIVFEIPNMPGWNGIPLRQRIADETGLLVVLGNDANVAALGEWHFGGGRGCEHLVYITVSTGIGCGVIMDGRLLLGRLGAGTELGHLIIDESYPSWEAMASGTALAQAARNAMYRHPSLLHSMATHETVTAAHVAEAARRGDVVARTLMEREAYFLGLGFVNALHLFSPEIILVGGSVVLHNPTLLEGARQVVHQRALADLYRQVPIRLSPLGDDAGVFGAVALVQWHAAG